MIMAATLASGMSFLAATMINIAIPRIQEYFGVGLSHIQWVINGYMLALSVLILISGSLGDRYGQKNVFMAGIGFFSIASLLSGLASSIGQLIFFQVLQGVGAAMMVPGSLAILNVCFKVSEKGRVVGIWAGLSGAMAALGPFVAGGLVQAFDWRGVLFFNVPLGIFVLVVAYLFVPGNKASKKGKLDIVGMLLIAGSLCSVSFGLINGPVLGWTSPAINISFVLAAAFIAAFYHQEKLTANPLIPFSIFKDRLVLGSNLATFFLYFALNSTLFFLVLNFQQIQEYSPLETGLAVLPITLMIAWLAGPSGSIADKIGPRLQMILGPVIVALSMLVASRPGLSTNYAFDYFPSFILFGAGIAFVIAPLTKSALSVKDKLSGTASGINNSVARIAALMAIAVMGAVMLSAYGARLESGVEGLQITQAEKDQILEQKGRLAAIDLPETLSTQEEAAAKGAINNAFVYGFRRIMYVNALFAFIAGLISYFLIGKRPSFSKKKLFQFLLRLKTG